MQSNNCCHVEHIMIGFCFWTCQKSPLVADASPLLPLPSPVSFLPRCWYAWSGLDRAWCLRTTFRWKISRYLMPVTIRQLTSFLYGLTWRRQPWRFRHQRWRGGGRHGHRPATPRRRRSPISECRTLILHKYCSHFNSSRANDVIPSL